ncbi:MAG TPA: hypothetical protein VF018_15355 [Acidobacteriaceae bacterium]
MQRWWIYLLLVLASAHCARAIFFVNTNAIVMQMTAYEHGQDQMPFQGRVLMEPAMRWAHQSRAMQHISDRFNENKLIAEPYTPEKVLSIMIGCVAVCLLGLLANSAAREVSAPLWWLPWTVVLAILYSSYAARVEQAYWYPYDLPEFLLFGLGTMFAMRRQFAALLLLMPLLALNRETAILLVPLWIAAAWPEEGESRRRTVLVLQTAALVAAWGVVRVLIARHFAHNPSMTGSRIPRNLQDLLNPRHWPQMASALGFLLPAVTVNWRRLSPRSRRMLGATWACMPVLLYFGIWTESRIFDEFTLLVAVLASEALISYLKQWRLQQHGGWESAGTARPPAPAATLST